MKRLLILSIIILLTGCEVAPQPKSPWAYEADNIHINTVKGSIFSTNWFDE